MTEQWTDIFTGVEDPDRVILLNLPDKKLFRVCQLNRYAEKLCNNGFWMRRFEQKFGATIGEGNKINYREEYKKYSNITGFYDLIKFAIQNKHNDLAIALINKHVIPLLHKEHDAHNNSYYLNRYIELSVDYDNFPIFIVLYKIGEEFKIEFYIRDVMSNAAKSGSYSIVKFIVDTLKYDPKHKEKIMQEAANSNNLAIVRFLHQHGYPLDADIFEIAIIQQNIDMIKYFLEEAAEKLPVGSLSNNADRALVRLGVKMLTYMQDHGYDILKNNPDILINAIEANKENVVKWLIDHGADVNVGDGGPLYASLRGKSYKIAKILIDAGANPNNENVVFEAISDLKYRVTKPNVSALNFLIENGLNLLEVADIISKDIKSPNKINIYAIKELFNIVGGLGTKQQQQEFYGKIFDAMIRVYTNNELNDLLRQYDIKGTKELFSAAVKYYKGDVATLLIKQGLKEFDHGIICTVSSPNFPKELLVDMFAAGAVLNDEDIERLVTCPPSTYNNETFDKLKILIEHGLDLSKTPAMRNYYMNTSYMLTDDIILFLYDHGVKNFKNSKNENRLQQLLQKRPKTAKGKGKEKESSKEVDSSTELVRCAGKTQTGAACKRKCPKDDKYCFAHK